MMTTAPQGPARVLTPLLQTPPTANASFDSVIEPDSRQPQAPEPPASNIPARPAGAPPGPRRGARTPAADPVSDRATTLLIRRILCPQHLDKGKATPPPLEDLLPPLTSRNDVDLQLYALIAIILREFVQNWYNKITPDETFVAEIVQVIAHITRTLEQRLRKVDLESLLFDELPSLLDRHITAYRTAQDPVVHHPVEANAREIYHSLCPLPALSPTPCPGNPASLSEQSENEVAYRQLLVHAVLAVVLPTEDLENDCLTALVGQIFSELIVANAVANKLSEPWLIYEMLIMVSRVVQQRRKAESGGALGNGRRGGSLSANIQGLFWTFLQWCFQAVSSTRVLIAVLMASRSVPFRVSRGAGHHHGPGRDLTSKKAGLETRQPTSGAETPSLPVKTPVLAFRCWSAISNLIEMDVRMPWLHGTLSLLQWIAMTGPGHVADVNGRLDRLLSYAIHRYLLDAAALPPLLRNVRAALFPNNLPGASTLAAPSSDTELAALRRRCARALWAIAPNKAAARLFLNGRPPLWSSSLASSGGDRHSGEGGRTRSGTAQEANADVASTGASAIAGRRPRDDRASAGRQRERRCPSEQGSRSAPSPGGPTPHHTNPRVNGDDDENEILDEIERSVLEVFGDAYCNKHLVYGIVELVLVRLLPELAEKGVIELWAERLA